MKCGAIQPAMRTFLVRALSFSAVTALTLNPALTPVLAADYRAPVPAVADAFDLNSRQRLPERGAHAIQIALDRDVIGRDLLAVGIEKHHIGLADGGLYSAKPKPVQSIAINTPGFRDLER